MGICTECSKRPECKRLCKRAKAYLAEIEEEWEEKPVVYYYEDEHEMRVYDGAKNLDVPLYSDQEKAVLSRLIEYDTRDEIAKSIGITRDNLKHILQRIKKKRDRIYHI